MRFPFYIFIPVLLIGCTKPRHSDVTAPFPPVKVSHSSLSVESFRFIGTETTLKQVIEKLGSPVYLQAGGFTPDVCAYYLSDGSKVYVSYMDGKIVYVTHGKEALFGHPYFPQR